ncbi:MAG: tRNA (guanine(10)-N(2))-dimethyltransferase, partial [Candidatus Aenigmarchaeota archaeon]|nr:tRNA (guanine(10)-N(2))-dimethyltransferase [Candidatus Aenigmarchaeota archaeon]
MYQTITEGAARIKAFSGNITKKDEVFYNTHMKFNRDISVIALKTYQKLFGRTLNVMDVLSATGVRGIRYALECEGIDKIIMNDLNPHAFELIEENVKLNGIKNAEVFRLDACELLSRHKYLIDFVDVDPFGSPISFLDAAARAVSNKGFLGITATDTAPLSGTYPKTCRRRYGAVTFRSDIGHEIGLRILIANIARECAKYDKGITPVLSFSMRHYFRIFARIKKTKSAALKAVDSIGYLWLCKKCGSRGFAKDSGTKKCPSCKSDTMNAGPLWIENIYEKPFLEKMNAVAGTGQEKKFLEKLILESEKNTPLYDIHQLAKLSGKAVPKTEKVLEVLSKKGFFAVNSITSGHHIKT